MSREQLDFLKNIVGVGFKGVGIVILSMLGFFASKAYNQFESTMTDMKEEVNDINKTLRQLERKVDKLELYNDFQREKSEKK